MKLHHTSLSSHLRIIPNILVALLILQVRDQPLIHSLFVLSPVVASPSSSTPSVLPPCPPLKPTPLFKRQHRLKSKEFKPSSPSPLAPILIGLHGLGDRIKSFSRIRRHFPASWRMIFLQAPLYSHGGFGWYRFRCAEGQIDLHTSVTVLTDTIRRIKQRYPKAPIGLFGFSQGGVMSLEALNLDPSLYQAVASLSGYWMDSQPPQKEAHPYPVLIAHGQQDKVVPWTQGKRSADLFKEAGYDIRWISFRQKHQIPRSLYPQLISFFRKYFESHAP